MRLSSVFALLLFAPALALHLLATLLRVYPLSALALVLGLVSLVLLVWGAPALHASRYAFITLVLMIPIPFIDQVSPALESFISNCCRSPTRARQAEPSVRVLSAPLAPTLEESPFAQSDAIYLRQLYRLGAQNYFDVLSANAFGQDLTPEDPPQLGVLNFERVVLLRQVMEQHGDASRPIWITEYGWNASPESFPKSTLTWQRVTEAE